ncbi:MAG: hypothetical protein IPG21_03690 [Saprospiraceae bacterium]|nr:hypothetical protein [Candidatus Vicinibacter affinis]
MIADIGIELMRYCDQKSSPIPDGLRILERKPFVNLVTRDDDQGFAGQVVESVVKAKNQNVYSSWDIHWLQCAVKPLAEGWEEDGLLHNFLRGFITYDHIIEFVKEIPLASKIIFHKQDALEGISNL